MVVRPFSLGARIDVTTSPCAGRDSRRLVLITVNYTIRKNERRNNLVFPFYIRKGRSQWKLRNNGSGKIK